MILGEIPSINSGGQQDHHVDRHRNPFLYLKRPHGMIQRQRCRNNSPQALVSLSSLNSKLQVAPLFIERILIEEEKVQKKKET